MEYTQGNKPEYTGKDEAALEAYQYFHENIRPLPMDEHGRFDFSRGEAHNNDVDAFRHAYVSGVYAMEKGDPVANVLGQANEIVSDIKHNTYHHTTDEAHYAEKNMDLWNNEQGRRLAVGATSKEEIAERVKEALEKGELITHPGEEGKEYKVVGQSLQELGEPTPPGDTVDFHTWLQQQYGAETSDPAIEKELSDVEL